MIKYTLYTLSSAMRINRLWERIVGLRGDHIQTHTMVFHSCLEVQFRNFSGTFPLLSLLMYYYSLSASLIDLSKRASLYSRIPVIRTCTYSN